MLGLPSCHSRWHVRPIIFRIVLFAGIWFVLCEGDVQSWPFAVPTILLAVWVSLQLDDPQEHTPRLFMLARNLPFFLYKSLLSGVDVMVRVLHPQLPIAPGLIEYPLTISHEPGRVLLANSISLLPGTISAQLADNRLIIHSLDKGLPTLTTIRELEERIAGLYAQPLSEKNNGELP
jgi:multicomponent Na+:H+ antiporter subunit E